jgi:hypothetical protein
MGHLWYLRARSLPQVFLALVEEEVRRQDGWVSLPLVLDAPTLKGLVRLQLGCIVDLLRSSHTLDVGHTPGISSGSI